ncbi:hypothetical protein ES703_113111 [subsurface metagenome]
MEAHEEGMRRLTAELPASLHSEFKTEVSRQGLDLRAVVISLVKSWLKGETKIKVQPIGRSFETTIHPGADGWEKSIEKIINGIVEKKLAMKEAENGNPGSQLEVHTVEPVIEKIEEPGEPDNPEIEVLAESIIAEEKIVAEKEIVAENGVVAETVITGKKVAVAKKIEAERKSTLGEFLDWLLPPWF